MPVHAPGIAAWCSATPARRGTRIEKYVVLAGKAAGPGDRCRRSDSSAGLKASLIMRESTSARASVLARHWYHLGRVRSLAEVAAGIDAITPESIIAHLERRPPRDFITVTLGAKPLEVPA